MRTLTFALAALLTVAFASRLTARPSAHVDSSGPTPTLTGNTGTEDGGTKGGDDDDEDIAIVHA